MVLCHKLDCMLLTITTTHSPATDLGYLLHKNPARVQSFELSSGQAHVFYPEATEDRCTAALLLDVDPVALVRSRKIGPESFALGQYVNERPYVASSFMSNAISRVFGTAMSGGCSGEPELADMGIPLVAKLSVVPCRGGEDLLQRLFEPLGYVVTAEGYPLDERFPDWGESAFFTVALEKTCRLSELLTHQYVLMPALDDKMHCWAEWTREEFQNWANDIGERFSYSVRFLPVGPKDAKVGRRRRWRCLTCWCFLRDVW